MNTVGENIKTLRKKAKLTQQQLADKAHMSRSYLADVERNRYNPSVDTLKSIANALNVSVSSIIKEDDSLPNLNQKEEKDIAKKLENILASMDTQTGLSFNGEPLDEETKELVREAIESNLRLAKKIAKQKFASKKY